MKSLLFWIGSFVASFYIATTLILFIFQRSLLYFPDDRWVEPAEASAPGFQTVEISAAPDSLRSWWKAPPKPDAPVVLHFHGNAGSVADRAAIYKQLAGDDFGLLAAEYPGYAGNGGEISEASFFAAAETHYIWLIAQGVKPDKIIIAGQSLGSGVAVWLAARKNAAGLLLEAPYSSITQVAQGRVKWLPIRYLLKDHYDSLSRIGDIDMPVAWVHGRRDNVVPMTSGSQLFAAAKGPKCAKIITGAGHNDLWSRGIGPYWRANIQTMTQEGRCTGGDSIAG